MIKFFQNNRLFVHFLTLTVVMAGFFALKNLRREARPTVDFKRLAISVAYPGSTAENMESLVTNVIEEKIAQVDGLEEYQSVTFPGSASFTVKIDDTHPRPDEVIDEVREKILEIQDLPEDATDPTIFEVKSDEFKIIRLALWSNWEPVQFYLKIKELEDFLENQEGVKSAEASQLGILQLKIQLDPSLLLKYDVSYLEVERALRNWSKKRPAGLFKGDEKTYSLSVGKDLETIEALSELIVRSNDFGSAVLIGDLAKLEYDIEMPSSYSIIEGVSGVYIEVIKKGSADIVETVGVVNSAVAKFKQKNSGLQSRVLVDESKRVQSSLKVVVKNALFGLLLVLICLILFLDWRSALVTSIGIPIAVFGGLLVLYLIGFTLNSLVITGMIIVMGMLVDDAIVVCENIYSHLEKGKTPFRAAVDGVKEIFVPLVATVFTTILAFAPLVFMKGIMGQFISVIPMTVIALLLISLFEALVILPVHAREIMRVSKNKKENWSDKLRVLYERYVSWSLGKKWWILCGFIAVIILSGAQGKVMMSKFSLFPARGLNGASIRVELPVNTSSIITEQKVKHILDLISKIDSGPGESNAKPLKDIESLTANINAISTGGMSGSRQLGSHLGSIQMGFTEDPNFYKREKKLLKKIKGIIKNESSDDLKLSLSIDRPGPPIGKPIQIQVTSKDEKKAEQVLGVLKSKLQSIQGVQGLETDVEAQKESLGFKVHSKRAQSMGVSLGEISQTLFGANQGKLVTELDQIKDENLGLNSREKVEVVLEVDSDKISSPQDLLDLQIRSNKSMSGGLGVGLKSFVTLETVKQASSIQHLNGMRTMTLFGEVDEALISGREANQKIKPLIKKLMKENPTMKIKSGGGEKQRMEILSDTMSLYLYALIFIFMVISLSFRSLIYPFFVLVTIPMGLVGVIWALSLHGQSLSLMGLVGVVGLSGVVVNISIILIKFMQNRLKEKVPFEQAVIQASGARLRPVLITTVTTLVGLFPTIYGLGGMDVFIQPIALVLGWGLFVATILTLLVLPAFMCCFKFILVRANNSV